MKQGDIIIVEFPFSDLSERKLRPAVVLSNSSYNRYNNLVLAGIYGSSNPCSISITHNDLQHKKLRKDSYISLQNIFSAEHALVGKPIDALTKDTLAAVLKKLHSYF